MISRRAVLAAVIANILKPRRSTAEQKSAQAFRIGFLSAGSAQSSEALILELREGLREHGWIEGKNVDIEYSYASLGGPSVDDRAKQLATLDLDVIVTSSTPASVALKRAGVLTPVVFAGPSEPIEVGLVESLARPGRNFTGLTSINRELVPKRVELLKELVPTLRRLSYVGNPNYASHRHSVTELTEAARRLGLLVEVLEARGPGDFDVLGTRLKRRHDAALVVEQSSLFFQAAEKIVALELDARIPAVYAHRRFVDLGGTVCYGVNLPDLLRRAAGYVDRILRGARPTDLPVAQPTKFDLAINLKTAKALGLTVPPSLLLRADHVVE